MSGTRKLQITGFVRSLKKPMKISFTGFQDGEVLAYGEFDYSTSIGFIEFSSYDEIGYRTHRNKPVFE